MRILHTADWHLGQKLYEFGRLGEQEQFLIWLKDTINEKEVDILIIAGDIFDVTNPPLEAQRLYYNFLKSLLDSTCKQIIIVSGNHDAPLFLDAPREILSVLNVRVVGKAAALDADADGLAAHELVCYPDEKNPICAVAAVPYLRLQDLIRSVSGESSADAATRAQDGIRRHYDVLADYVAARGWAAEIPVLATGHLFAAGGALSSKGEDFEKSAEKDILYVGKLGQTRPEFLRPDVFHYVALGHLHKPHDLPAAPNVRYSGSPIALSFSERDEQKSVTLLEFDGPKLLNVVKVPIPQVRKLVRFTGEFDEVQEKIANYAPGADFQQKHLLEIIVHTKDSFGASTEIPRIDEAVKRSPYLTLADVPRFKRIGEKKETLSILSAADFKNIEPEEVFRELCKGENFPIDEQTEVLAAFKEVLESITK